MLQIDKKLKLTLNYKELCHKAIEQAEWFHRRGSDEAARKIGGRRWEEIKGHDKITDRKTTAMS